MQGAPFEFWDLLRGVIGAGVDGFVINPPNVCTPTAADSNRKLTRQRDGKSPRPQVSSRDRTRRDEEVKEDEKLEVHVPAP